MADAGGRVGLLLPDDAECLLGRRATRAAVLRWFRLAAIQSPDYLTFFFSGHGSLNGLQLSDGFLSYKVLAAAIARVNAPRVLFVTDTCHAGAFDAFRRHAGIAGVDVPATQLLILRAIPGMRLMFSVGRGRSSGESRKLGHGFFTYALLRSLRRSRGDLELGGVSCISDARAFAGAAAIARSKFGQVPLAVGLTGDLPLVMSEADMVIGSASIALSESPQGLAVRTVVGERLFVPTFLRASLVDARDRVLFSTSKRHLPVADRAGSRTFVPFPYDDVLGDPWCQTQIERVGRIGLRWEVAIEDGYGYALDAESHLTWLAPSDGAGDLLSIA